MSILDLFQHAVIPTNLRSVPKNFYEGLADALKSKNLEAVADHLARIPSHEHRQPSIVAQFLANFSTDTIGMLFGTDTSTYDFVAIFDAPEVATEEVWTWLIEERDLQAQNVLNQAITRLETHTQIEQQQQSIVNFFKAASPHITPDEFLSEIAPLLNKQYVQVWAPCVWGHLRTFGENEWRKLLTHSIRLDELLTIEPPASYAYFTKSLQEIPHLRASFDQYFNDLTQQHLEFVQNFSSPQGIKKSKGFQQLSRVEQKRLREEISEIYEPDNGLGIALYKDVLGYSNEDLFLKNFGFDEFSNAYRSPLLRILSNGLEAFHPLHIILQKPEGLLSFNSTATPLIVEQLDHPLVLENIFNQMGHDTFSQILKQHPQLVHWKDSKGNSLGHWCMTRVTLTPNWAKVLTEHPTLLEPNHKGFTLRDVILVDLEEGYVDESDLVALDHILISQAVSQATPVKATRQKKM